MFKEILEILTNAMDKMENSQYRDIFAIGGVGDDKMRTIGDTNLKTRGFRHSNFKLFIYLFI